VKLAHLTLNGAGHLPEGNQLMSIYDSIGGAPAARAAVDDFYARTGLPAARGDIVSAPAEELVG